MGITRRGGALIAWLAWWAGTAGLAGYLGYRFWAGDERVFLPGETTHGHYQIEIACDACHAPDGGVDEQSCLDCHQEELDDVNDSHPKPKFRDVRKAHLLEDIDALSCIECHQEHAADRTHPMGVSMPTDYCLHCHEDIGEERPTHEGLEFMSCATAGCHNYHDNTALYYEFLERHAHDPDLAEHPVLPARDFGDRWRAKYPDLAVALTTHDGPADSHHDVVAAHLASAHAQAGVDCSACHTDSAGTWNDSVNHESCASCHEHEVDGWLQGLHGMRVAQGLSPMTPGEARLPMHADVHHQELDCTSCHGAHDFDTRRAAVDACLSCHADDHSMAYQDSAHYQAWIDEVEGRADPGTGVSCATCHMPRVEEKVGGGRTVIRVEHNQNRFLAPNEKMIRTSCQTCHGLGFAIDALADPELIRGNFHQPPSEHVPSIDWVLDHQQRTRRTDRD